MMLSRHLILCRPLPLPPPILPIIKVFSNESTLRMRWPKYWSFSFSIIPSKEIPGLISFRMDWLDLLAVLSTNFSKKSGCHQNGNEIYLFLKDHYLTEVSKGESKSYYWTIRNIFLWTKIDGTEGCEAGTRKTNLIGKIVSRFLGRKLGTVY